MSKRLSKHEVKNPDAFLQGASRASRLAYENRQVLVALVVAVFLGGAGVTAYNSYSASQEMTAQEAFYKVSAEIQKKEKAFNAATAIPKEGEKASEPKVEKTGDLTKDFGNLPEQLEEMATNHSGTKASLLAANKLAQLYTDYGQPQKAVDTLRAHLNGHRPGSMVHAVTSMHLATSLELQGQCQEAIGIFDQLIQEKSYNYLKPEALLKKGVCLESLGKTDEAKQMYRQVSEEHKDTSAGRAGQKYLRLLEFKSKG